jgi:predicted DNA-binding protein
MTNAPKKLGRPRVYNSLSTPTTIRMEQRLLNALDAKAARLGITRGAAIQAAVEKWVRK